MESTCFGDDPIFHAIVDGETRNAIGVASYVRIDAANGVIEVGHINYSPELQQTRAATEAMYLMMRRVFSDLGFRRYEWKCDALNAPSRKAAERLGFSYDGLFQQATTYKGRNRDTAWFSVLDGDWPNLETAYTEWLDESNFDGEGKQKSSLADLISAHKSIRG
jgi:RimJ/RimL family protein N-acetyltransferase